MIAVDRPAPVPRETLAVGATGNRRYRSPSRQRAAEHQRTALIAAVLVLANQGNYRGTAQHIAALAKVRRQSIARYFGSVDMLYRVVAREHWQQVVPCLDVSLDGFPHVFGNEAENAVWLVLVGKPRALS